MESKVVAFRMQLNPGQEQEYRRRHDALWPELREALLDAGVLDYRIFLDPGSHALFAVLTRKENHGLAALRQSELMQRWWTMMADIMSVNLDASPVEVPLLPVFALTED